MTPETDSVNSSNFLSVMSRAEPVANSDENGMFPRTWVLPRLKTGWEFMCYFLTSLHFNAMSSNMDSGIPRRFAKVFDSFEFLV